MLNKLFNPSPDIGALEVSNLVLRFLRLENGGLQQASVQLPPDVIIGGQIVDKPRLVSVLKFLHQQIQPLKKSIHTVLVLSAANVYTQSFSMPPVTEREFKKTAELNMQMIAPIDIKSSYHGYEVVGGTREGKAELFGAFADSSLVNEFMAALNQANFKVVAVEFPALSLARLIREYSAGLKSETPYLSINLSGDGSDILVIKNGHVHSGNFIPWSDIQKESGGRKLTAENVRDYLARRVRQIINSYAGSSGNQIKEAVVVNNPISREIIAILRESFSLTVQLLTVGKFSQLQPFWYVALGAALRGLVPRSKDNFITLTPAGAGEEYYLEARTNFIKIWRNVIGVVLGFIILVFAVADLFLIKFYGTVAKGLSDQSLAPLEEVVELQSAAEQFNKSVDFALQAQELSEPWSPLLEKIRVLVGQRITIERLSVNEDSSALIIAKAVNDSAVIAFKNSIEKEDNFKDVILPLSNIKVNPDGTVSFTLQFKIVNL